MSLYYNNREFASSSSTIVERPSPVRRLPQLPPSNPASPHDNSSRRSSRPLPKIPRALVCKQCRTIITSNNVLLPLSQIPQGSRAFRGFAGKASLFTETYNVRAAKPGIQLMATGAHTMSEISCGGCSTYLGWRIVRAHEPTERWKEGHFLLELENLYAQDEHITIAPLTPRPRARVSSGSDTTNSD